MNRFSIIALALALCGAQPGRAAPAKIEVGKPFPHLVLPAADDGRPLSVAAFRGKKVILQVFASW